ncbi:MAG: HD domain-containing protein [Anaerolineae bacterium]|nr:HD domain-containing protein [Anaerolineae bacterium]
MPLTQESPNHPHELFDPIYGIIDLSHPLLDDLYHTRAVQRLAHIYQAGITAFIRPERQTTRLEHSLGVLALLQFLDAPLEEQAAGLLHDVPHTAFSHVVDFVFPNAQHTYHEVHREELIADSDLPACLERHGLDWRTITESDNFSLLEQPLPALCADRLDYFLRDGLALQLFEQAEVNAFLESLRKVAGRIVVGTLDAARWLGEAFIAADDAVWCSVQEVGWYACMAEALRAAMAANLLTEADLRGTDRALMMRLRAAPIPEVQHWLARLRPEVDFVRVAVGGDLTVLPKVRAVDPPVLHDERILALSELDPAFAALRSNYIASKQGAWQLRIISA